MKSYRLTQIAVITLFATLAMPLGLGAQDDATRAKKAQHHHYKLIDMGTFGGPNSSINWPFFEGTVNNRGTTVGWSATAIPTSPTSSFLVCGGLDAVVPYITHAFAWQEGIVTDLGSLGGPDYCSEPFWINERGDIVGASENGQIDPLFFGLNQVHAVLWRDGQMIDLGTLGGNQVGAFGINNRGQVVGVSTNAIPDPYCFFGTVQQRTFLWEDGQMLDLGTLGGNCAGVGVIDTAVHAINEKGQVVGASSTSSIPNPVTGTPQFDPFLWEKGKGMIDLGTLGGAFGGAQAINDRGQVVGQSSIGSDPGACNGFPDNGNNNCHPFLSDKGKLIDLNTTSTGGAPNFVADINDAGEIVGWATFPNAPFDAFLWKNGVATDLGHLSDCYSFAHAVNSSTQVVGGTISCDGTVVRAVLWERGSMVDLNTLIPGGLNFYLANASDIDERGEIDGIGVPPGVSVANYVTQGHGFLLIPCDDDHPGVEGCDYSMVDAAEVSSDTSATRAPQSTQLRKEAIARMMGASRNPFLRRYRLPGLRPSSNN